MSSPLHRLAARVGILDGYANQAGEWRATDPDTRIALLHVLGVPASTDREAAELLAELDRKERESMLAPCRVVRQDSPERDSFVVQLLPHERSGFRWQATVRAALDASQGRSSPARGGSPGRATDSVVLVRVEGREHSSDDGVRRITIPVPREAGWYEVELVLSAGGSERAGRQQLAVAPTRCHPPPGTPAWGITANLYTVRSSTNWGCGDLGDLRDLVAATARDGGAFVGVNPLHALRNQGSEVSPYSPVSRLFRNPIYLRVEEVPELAACPEALELLANASFREELVRLRSANAVDYEGVLRLQQKALRLLHGAFLAQQRDGDTERATEYRAYRREMGGVLEDFALFLALDEHVATKAGRTLWFRHWPDGLADVRSPAVRRAREALGSEVEFHCWVQFELDRQLGRVAEQASGSGMSIGLYHDLAIASSGGGSDAWAFGDIFTDGVSIGAPPDPLAPQGQDWGMPPLNPLRLADSAYGYWRHLLRASFRHSGALRMDHILGLVRQFWIPHGATGDRGAYVRFPTNDLMGILALESSLAKSVVVGEDLGTVPPELPALLAEWGVMSSRVLYFERDASGGFASRHGYPREALTSANTHDLSPLAGYWTGRDIRLRHELGILDDDGAAAARSERSADRARLLDRLAADGCLDSSEREILELDRDRLEDSSREDGADISADERALEALCVLADAVHGFLRGTPSFMVGLSLDDLVLEQDPVNLPGVSWERYHNWTRRLRTPLEDLVSRGSIARVRSPDPSASRTTIR